MSSVDVGGMEWKEMVELVNRRFNKLAMCKRGAIATDINEQMDKLGKCPAYTKEERQAITDGLAKGRQKALTPSMALIKKFGDDIRGLCLTLEGKVARLEENAYVHPGKEAWKEKRKMIGNQQEAREAALDGDFQDVLDSFMLKLWDLDKLPEEYVKMEEREW